MKNKGGYFTNLNSAMLVATFFSLWLAVYFEYAVEDTLAYILILSFGILHGANDIKLLQVTSSNSEKKPKYLLILLYYVAFVLLVATLFYLIPGITLLLFVLFSAYHFGEQHWVARLDVTSTWEGIVLYTSYGLLILFLLFAAHSSEVITIVLKITSIEVPEDIFIPVLGISALIFVSLYIKIAKQISSRMIVEIFYLLVFFIIFNTASLLWAFAIYFIIWHSVPSLSDQIKFLYGDFTKIHFIKYLKSSFVYWIVSVLALILLFTFLDDSSVGFLPSLFSFLAAITFPHVFVISKLNRS